MVNPAWLISSAKPAQPTSQNIVLEQVVCSDYQEAQLMSTVLIVVIDTRCAGVALPHRTGCAED
jgi:hypothetical protein